MITQNRVILFLMILLLHTTTSSQTREDAFNVSLEKGFYKTPDSIQTSVYWYWISDNLSEEGVLKDLNAMKEVGFNKVFIGFIGLPPDECPYGDVKFFTEEWWRILHTALKTATELGLEIGIFNAPGWSQTGGPWITSEQSMRYLTSSALTLKGAQPVSIALETPIVPFQDVKVLAFPVSEHYLNNILAQADTEISVSSQSRSVSGIFSLKPPETVVNMNRKGADPLRSLKIQPAGYINACCSVYVVERGERQFVKHFELDRTNARLNVGFEPYAPIVVSLPEVTAEQIQFVFSDIERRAIINDLVISSTPVVERYPEKTLAKMYQTPLPHWDSYTWDKPYPLLSDTSTVSASEVMDISGYLTPEGILNWDVPAGTWHVMRIGMTPTNVTNDPASAESKGLEVDKMSKKHVQSHFDAFLGEIMRRIPPDDRKSWKMVVIDSYETGGQNFTDDYANGFMKTFGYDPIPYLPVFSGHVIGSADISDRFLWDVRRFVADQLAYGYMAGFREICHQNGFTTWLENYGHWGFPGEFLSFGGQSDEVAGEFWSEGDLGSIENRAASSCAHIYGKPKVYSESFTCAGLAYSRHPGLMKKRGDWSFTEGINSTLLNVSIQQSDEDLFPGIDAPFGNEFNRKNTWYPFLDLFISYLKRCNFMLQQGLDVADIAYFIGDDAPKMTGITNPEVPAGYKSDYINSEVIIRGLTVQDGEFVLPHGTKYKVLVLPKQKTMRPELLSKLEQLVSDGGIIVGYPPEYSPSLKNYPDADREIKEIAEKMWTDKTSVRQFYGKGRIYSDVSLEHVFDEIRLVPDCSFQGSDSLLYVHRRKGDTDIYFISNQRDSKNAFTATFRVHDMQPELWDPVAVTTRILPLYEQKDNRITIPLQLEANESTFVVFRRKAGKTKPPIAGNYPEYETLVSVDTPWIVTFESDRIHRGVQAPVVFYKLQDWSEHPDENIRFYSGVALYKNSFELEKTEPGKHYYLDIGQVSVMAKVKINETYVGGLWTPPYRLDITQHIKAGKNSLEIEVVNTWVNRLIGDQGLPVEQRRLNSWNSKWEADSSLQKSGLTGVVRILCSE